MVQHITNTTQAQGRALLERLLYGRCLHRSHTGTEVGWAITTVHHRTGIPRQTIQHWVHERQRSTRHTGWDCHM
jgi:hypothetical protein